MFRHFFFIAIFAIPGIAQDSRVISLVNGVVASDEALAGNHLTVSLTETVTHKAIGRSFVGGDGSFEFRDVPPGQYTVELVAANGDTIRKDPVSLNSSADQIELHLPGRENKSAPAGTVSVRELRHPISAKSTSVFEAAQRASAKGDFLKAVEILRRALNDPAAEPYARMNIGVAYIRAGQAGEAVPDLKEAVRLMPDDAVARTNLAYALLLTKRGEEAEQEARRALQLDKNNSRARWVMGSVLLAKGSGEEAVENLRLASREIPQAKVMLAQFYARRGQKDEAVRELREFLPQASDRERATVEQWLSKLAAK